MNDTQQLLYALTKHVDETFSECDGATRLVHLALYRKGISHVCYAGSVIGAQGEVLISLHFWTEANGLLIDYRCRRELGEVAPHGVFRAADHPSYHYQGHPVTFDLAGCLAMELVCQPAFIQAVAQAIKGWS